MKDLLTTLENSRTYTLAVAEAMPADQYHSKPAEGIWNFGELMHHIGYGIDWWKDNYVLGKKTEWEPPEAKTGKTQVKQYLNRAYDDLAVVVGKIKAGDNAVKGFYTTLDHITHHRGQATIHLRTKGIEPPVYTY